MQTPDLTAASVEYRCVLVRSHSHHLLAVAGSDQHRLPRIRVPRWTRPAQELQKAIKAKWELDVFVLQTWIAGPGVEACAIAEALTPETTSPFEEIRVEELMSSEFSTEERHRLESLLGNRTKGHLSRLGWMDEAVAWIESATGARCSSKPSVAQWNAGGGFVLLRVPTDAGRHYWLKATGEPNAHEFAITRLLSESYPEFLPRLVAIKAEWNAWLMEDAGQPISNPPSVAELVSAAGRMAALQILTAGEAATVLAAGAFDQRLPILRSHIDEVIAYLSEAMARQGSTKAARLSRVRLLEVGEFLRDACCRLEALAIPDTLIHNDLNPGNILSDGATYVFVDWSEAAVGNPFLSCERLCQLNRAHSESVRNVYRKRWSPWLSAQSMEEAIALTPLFAIYAYLFGRGDWIGQTENVLPQFESYARSLARRMDRAAQDLSLLEVLCR